MVQNQGAFRILSSIAFETVNNHREGKQKKRDFGVFFHFQFF